MQLKKVLGWAVVVFPAWYLFTQPQAAGNAVHNLLNLLTQPATLSRPSCNLCSDQRAPRT